MQSVKAEVSTSSEEGALEVPQAPSLARKPLPRFIIMALPTAVVLGPVASYPVYSGGFFTAYRLLAIPAAVIFFMIWRQHGSPRFAGSRALLVLTAVVTVLGIAQVIFGAATPRGAADHYIFVTSLILAWLTAAAVSTDKDTRDVLLDAWFIGFMVAAVLAVLHATGLVVPQTAFNILASQYAAVGREVGFTGTLGNPNDLAGFALAAAPLAYLAARRWDRPWAQYLVLLAAVAMSLVSLSRTALLGIILVPIVFLALRRLYTPGRVSVFLIISGYFLTLLVAINATQIGSMLRNVPYLGPILVEFDLGVQETDSARLSTWSEMIQESLQRIPLGAGAGQFEETAYEAGFALQSNAHNVFFEVFFEYGLLVGVAGLVWTVAVAVAAVQRCRHAITNEGNLVAAAGATSLVGLVIWGALTSTLITRPPWGLILGTAIGLICSVGLARRET